MSLSFSPTIRQQPAYGSTFVMAGVLVAIILILALSAPGTVTPDAILVGP